MLPIEEFEPYLPPVEKRLERYIEGVPVLGRPFPYNSDVCELPPEMMFMHEAVFPEHDKVDGTDLWDFKNVTPDIEKMWEVVQELRARVKELEDQ